MGARGSARIGSVRVLCLAGGGLRAAFQVPIIERLLAEAEYGLILGISAGAVNGVLAAQGDVALMRRGWESVGAHRPVLGVPGAFSLSPRPWRSLYTLFPLRRRLAAAVSLDRLRVPFGCGVVVRQTHEYRMLMSTEMSDDAQLHGGILGSCAIAGLVPPVTLHDQSGAWLLSDGGHRHNLPTVAAAHADRVTHIDAVFSSPLHHHPLPVHRDLAHSIAWTFEIELEVARQRDFEYLQAIREAGGATVRVFAPPEPTGGVLDGRPATMRARFEQGAIARDNPLEL
jgi:predicted acylesterase/phospholipase RssA